MKDLQPIYDALKAQGKIDEAVDLKLLHEAQDKEKDDFSSLCDMVLNTPEESLKHLGVKSYGEALVNYAKGHQKKLNSLVKAHLKKYPD